MSDVNWFAVAQAFQNMGLTFKPPVQKTRRIGYKKPESEPCPQGHTEWIYKRHMSGAVGRVCKVCLRKRENARRVRKRARERATC